MRKTLLGGVFVILMIPQIVFAAWWNPFSWNVFSFFHKNEAARQTQVIKYEPTNDATKEIEKPQKEIIDLKKQQSNSKPVTVPTTKDTSFNSFPTYKYKLISGGAPVLVAGAGERISLNITATIKNENVLPFITKVAIQNCKVSDGKNIINVSNDGGSYEFSKNALLPNQEAVVIFQVELSNSKKCNYNDTGVKICERPLEKEKSIISCDFSVATDDAQITGGWGKFYQTLVF